MSFNYWIEEDDHAKQREKDVPESRNELEESWVVETKGGFMHVRSCEKTENDPE